MKRICIVTSGHLSTCPRMVKAADALHEAGYAVRVVSASFMTWAREADEHLRQSRRWAWNVFDYEKSRARSNYLTTGLRFKMAQRLARARNPERSPFPLAARACSRAYPELLRLVLREPVDFIYGGTAGGLPVAFTAAQKLGVPFALDLEDFHLAEQEDTPSARFSQSLMAGIQSRVLSGAAFITVASPGVGEAVRNTHPGINPVTVMNVFPLAERPETPSVARTAGPLRLCWFSQTIGKDRGLEDAVRALKLLPAGGVELHLRGRCDGAARRYLDQLLAETGVANRAVIVHAPVPPSVLVSLTATYDVGLALEVPISPNRVICMNDLCTNKVFTCLMAGLALAASAVGNGTTIFDGAGFSYRSGDAAALAAGLRRWLDDPAALQQARDKAWHLASVRYNWEVEQKVLLSEVERVIGGPGR